MNPRRRRKMKVQKRCEALLAERFANTPRGTRRCQEQAQWLVQRISHPSPFPGIVSIGFAAFPAGPKLRDENASARGYR
jgi:hypothetical protein